MGKVDISNPVFFPMVNEHHMTFRLRRTWSVRSFRPRTSRLLNPVGWTGHWPSQLSCGGSIHGLEHNSSVGREAITPASLYLTLLRVISMSGSIACGGI